MNDDATISMPVDSSVPHHDSEGDYRHIEIQDDQVLLHGNSELEFGGVGKGYLIDVIR